MLYIAKIIQDKIFPFILVLFILIYYPISILDFQGLLYKPQLSWFAMFYHRAPRESAVSKEIFYFRIGIKLFQIIVFLDNNRFVFLIIVVITVKAFRQKFLRHFTHHDYYIDLPIISLHFIVVVKANKLISQAVSMLLEFRFGRCVKEDLS